MSIVIAVILAFLIGIGLGSEYTKSPQLDPIPINGAIKVGVAYSF